MTINDGSFTDPGTEPKFEGHVDYGNVVNPLDDYLPLNPDNTFDLEQLYDDEGGFTVLVQIGDRSDLTTTDETFVVTVNNVAPTLGPDATINEGDTFASVGSFLDVAGDFPIITVDYGDGSATETLIPNTDGIFALSHPYSNDGTFTVTVTADDGGSVPSTDTAQVTVNNVAPSVSVTNQLVDNNRNFTASGSFTDPGFDCDTCGTLEDFTATVNWGEFGDEPLKVTETPGSAGVLTQGTAIGDNVYMLPLGILIHGCDPSLPGTDVAGHFYRLPGTYIVQVTVDDDNAGTNSDTFVTTVLGAQDLKNRVISTLSPFDDHDVDKIIEKINESLEPKLWVDKVNLDPKKGHKVFDEEKNAVEKLQKIIKPDHDDKKDDDKKEPASPQLKAAAQFGIDNLVNADRVLAITAMLDATSVPVQDPDNQEKVDKENSKSAEEFAKGDAKRYQGEPDEAIEHYEKTWKHAQEAIKHANKIGNDSKDKKDDSHIRDPIQPDLGALERQD